MYYEEILLLHALYLIVARCDVPVPSSPAIAPVNEIIAMALKILLAPSRLQLMEYVAELGPHIFGRISAAFPPPLSKAQFSDHLAEVAAHHYLTVRMGSLWCAVRHVISLLPFDSFQRRLQEQPMFQFTCGAYGHKSLSA